MGLSNNWFMSTRINTKDVEDNCWHTGAKVFYMLEVYKGRKLLYKGFSDYHTYTTVEEVGNFMQKYDGDRPPKKNLTKFKHLKASGKIFSEYYNSNQIMRIDGVLVSSPKGFHQREIIMSREDAIKLGLLRGAV